MQEASEKKETDYAKTVIYQIECKDPNITKTYGGHSTNLIKRRQKHKSNCNNPNSEGYGTYVYQFIRDNGGWINWRVVWQYDYPCATRREAELEETKFIKENKCELNCVMPFVSEENKKIKNKEHNAKKREEETEEEKKERLEKKSAKGRESRANETEEEKKARKKKRNEDEAKRRAEETEEEKKKDNEKIKKDKLYIGLKRKQKKKLNKI